MDNYIAEYSNMWTRLNTITGYHNNLFIFTLTTSGAILTYAIQQDNSYVAIVNMIILILLRCRIVYYRDEYYQILAYIRKVLEPKMKLNSEVLMNLNKSGIANVQYFVYSILGLGTMATSIFIGKSSTFFIIILIAFNIMIVGLDIYYLFYSKKLYKGYENRISR